MTTTTATGIFLVTLVLLCLLPRFRVVDAHKGAGSANDYPNHEDLRGTRKIEGNPTIVVTSSTAALRSASNDGPRREVEIKVELTRGGDNTRSYYHRRRLGTSSSSSSSSSSRRRRERYRRRRREWDEYMERLRRRSHHQSSVKFQLKMFWEEGMEWQDSSEERKWCAECRDDCSEEERVEIKECDDDDRKQIWIYSDGRIKSYVNDDLCMTFRDKRIELERCGGRYRDYQEWTGFRTAGKFQLRPRNRGSKCLTQQHHPKSGEVLWLENCQKAEKNDSGKYDDTSYWVIGLWDGHSRDGFQYWY